MTNILLGWCALSAAGGALWSVARARMKSVDRRERTKLLSAAMPLRPLAEIEEIVDATIAGTLDWPLPDAATTHDADSPCEPSHGHAVFRVEQPAEQIR